MNLLFIWQCLFHCITKFICIQSLRYNFKATEGRDCTTCFILYFSRGTIGVYDLTIGNNCHLYLGSTGKTKRSGYISPTGIFDFDSLTVAAGGEVTATNNLVGANNKIQLSVSI